MRCVVISLALELQVEVSIRAMPNGLVKTHLHESCETDSIAKVVKNGVKLSLEHQQYFHLAEPSL